MQNQVKFMLGVLLITALSQFLIPGRGTSAPQNATSYDNAAPQRWYHEFEIVLPNAVLDPAGMGNWLLVAKQDDDDKNGLEAEGEEEEKDDKDSSGGGFDRLWDATCCG